MRQLKLLSIFFVLIAMASAVLAEPPASSGIVTRDSYNGGWVDIDTNSGLLSVVGVDMVQYCTGNASFDVFYYKDKNLQNGFRLNTVEKAYVQASVWPFTVFDCELFLTVPPLATGMANYRSHDNDYFGADFCEEKNNANAFGRRANGTLYSPSGEARRFSMHTWGLYDCETDAFPLFETKISLTK